MASGYHRADALERPPMQTFFVKIKCQLGKT